MTYSESASQSGKPKIAKKPAEYSALPGDRQAGAEGTRLVFFGNERLATAVGTSTPALRGLVEAGYQIKAVVSNYTQGVSRTARPLEIADFGKQHKLPLLTPARPADIIEQLRAFNAEAAVLAAYGRIVPQDVIDIFPKGIINIHPSLLPAYRGPTPLESVILDGQKTTGVSLMSLSAEMDAGPLYIQKEIGINGNETKQELADILSAEGSHLLLDNLPAILSGKLGAVPQDDEKATYTKLLSRQDGMSDWQEPAELIERKVRAYLGFPKLRGDIFNQQVYVTKARVASHEQDGQLVIECSSGWLEVLELVAPSGRAMSGADYIRGYKNT